MSNEKTRQLIVSALHGCPLSQLAETHGMSKSGVEKTLKRVIKGIYKQTRLARDDGENEEYSLIRAREDSRFILSKLDEYLSGALFDAQFISLNKNSRLDESGLSPRVLNPLALNNIVTVEDAISRSKLDLSKLEGFGKSSLNKLVSVLEKHGFELKKND